MQTFLSLILNFLLFFQLVSCKKAASSAQTVVAQQVQNAVYKPNLFIDTVIVNHDVSIKRYFHYMDSVVKAYDTLHMNEHVLVRANPWIIDSFAETDYYRRKVRGEFVFDQKQLIILKKGDTIRIPNTFFIDSIKNMQKKTWIDINIPEFKLRLVEGNDTVYTFPVRVGQNRQRYLAAVDKEMILRTRTGTGKISGYYFKDFFINPVDNKKFVQTKRDDDIMTMMPLLPWLEPTVNGECWGQLIHATTNENTLGKAYSNGCIGTAEGDIWRVYYYAPIGTKVVFRYDRTIIYKGDTIILNHIYFNKTLKKER